MTHLLANLGWVDFDLGNWDFPPSCPAAQPLLPNFHQPKQNRADSGTVKLQVNPTQVRQEMVTRPYGSIEEVHRKCFYNLKFTLCQIKSTKCHRCSPCRSRRRWSSRSPSRASASRLRQLPPRRSAQQHRRRRRWRNRLDRYE